MEKASMEGTQDLGAEGSEASLSLCGVPKGHLCVDSQGCLRTLLFTSGEQRLRGKEGSARPQLHEDWSPNLTEIGNGMRGCFQYHDVSL